MKSTILSKFSPLLLLVPFTFCLVSLVSAQSAAPSSPSTGLAVTPPTFEVNGNPGDIIKNTVKLENMHPYSVEIAVDRRNFTAIGEEGAVGLTEEETSFSLASWIEVNPTAITIPPKTAQYFTFYIKVPLQAEPGGHFGSLIFRTIPTEKLEGSGASLAQEIGALVLLRIAGETIEQANIESFKALKNLYETGPVNFEIRIKNLGNVHTKPTGNIVITNALGKQVATIATESKNVLPGATRRLDATWDTKWRLGRYSATYTAILSDQTTRSLTTTFTILPYRVLTALALILVILIVFFKKYQKRLSLAWKILRSGKA